MSGKFSCETCQVSTTGQEQYDQHLRGTKHAKKLKLLRLTSNKVSTPTTNPEEGIPVSGYMGKFVTSSNEKSLTPKSTGQTTAGSFSKPVQAAQQLLQSGQFGSLASSPPAPPHKAIKQEQQQQQPSDAAVMLVGNDPVMKAVKANLMGNLPTTRQAYEGTCSVCGVKYTSKSHEEQHLSGQKHKKKVKLHEDSSKVNSASFFCGFCNLQVNSMAQMDQHRSGSSHQKKVQQAQAKQMRPPVDVDSGPSSAKKMCGVDEPYIPPPQNPSQLNLQPLTYNK